MDAVQRSEALREAVVALVLETRAEYLRSGANALDHWNHLHDRMIVAARTSENIEQLVTTYRRMLRLGAPSSGFSAEAVRLAQAADADPRDALDLIESEIGLVIAMSRLEAERRRDAAINGGA
jgi:hypothetical protein